MQFLEKPWKMLKNVGALKFNNRKKKKLFGIRTKLSYCKVLHRSFDGYKKEKNLNAH